MRRAACGVVGACVLALLVVAPAHAASPDVSPATPAGETRPQGPLGPEVPRGAVERFLNACGQSDYVRAAESLDRRKIPRAARATRGPQLARELEAVLERSVALDLSLLSDEPEGERDDGLPPDRDLLAIVESESGPVELLLERTAVAGAPVWQVASDTVARIPELYTELGYGPFADRLPAPLVTIRFFGVRLWQWLGLFVVIVFATSVAWLAGRVIAGVGVRVFARAGLDTRMVTHALGPVQLLLAVMLAFAGVPFLALAFTPQRVVIGAGKALVIVAFTWLLLRAIDVMSSRAQRRFVKHDQMAAVSMVPLGRRVVKIVVTGLALMAALQNFGFNVTAIAAGLGIGGLAVALAAQKTVENLFGGVTLITDQPVRVGDFCRFGDAQGIVEDIGLRSTRIRTLDRTIVTIPNAQFSAMPLENLSRRDRIPVRATLALRPETGGARVREVLERLRTLFETQLKLDRASARARFVRLGPQIEIELFAYVLTTDWGEYLAVREQIFLAALDVVGTDVATLK